MAMYNGKVRGQKRRLKQLLKYIDEIKPYTKAERADEVRFEHYHVPSTVWIEKPKTSSKIKTVFCKAWIRKTEEILKAKPKDIEFCKVVCNLTVPKLWDSQIIIFYDRKYYESFWDRQVGWQNWTMIENGSSLKKERNIQTDLNEVCFKETIIDEEYTSVSNIWFYGEVNDGCI